jgi:hypothetical protein
MIHKDVLWNLRTFMILLPPLSCYLSARPAYSLRCERVTLAIFAIGLALLLTSPAR